MLTILSIDDDPQSLIVREAILRAEGFQVLSANSALEGIVLSNQHKIDVFILDYMMPQMDGEELAKVLKEQHPHVPIA